MKLVDIIAAAKTDQDLSGFVDAIPYAGFLGITVDETDGLLCATLASSDHIIGNPALPAIHGGVVGALLETTAILQLLWTQESATVPKTITITIDYLRSAGAKDTYAVAHVTKLGGRVANVHAYAWQDDPEKPVAALNGNFLIATGD